MGPSCFERLGNGRWPDLDPSTLNAEAAALGPLSVAPPSFLRFEPAPYLRPFDASDEHHCDPEHHNSGLCNGEFGTLQPLNGTPGRQWTNFSSFKIYPLSMVARWQEPGPGARFAR